MIIKYINEGAFGSYKNKTSKEDKLEITRKETNRILKEKERQLHNDLDYVIYNVIQTNEFFNMYGIPTDAPFKFLEFDAVIDKNSEAYPTILRSNPDKIKVVDYAPDKFIIYDKEKGIPKTKPFEVIFDKQGDVLNIFVRILVYCSYSKSHGIDSLDFNSECNNYEHALNEFIYHSEEQDYIIEKLKDWYDVDEVKWDYKYHLVNKFDPFHLFNNEIYTSKIRLDVPFSKFDDCIKHSFEHFFIQGAELEVGKENMDCNDVFKGNTCTLEDYSKYFRCATINIVFKKNNNITSLGDLSKLIMTRETVSKFAHTYRLGIFYKFVEKRLGNISLVHSAFGRENKETNCNPEDVIFTDELLQETIGSTNQQILDEKHYPIEKYICRAVDYNLVEDDKNVITYVTLRKGR